MDKKTAEPFDIASVDSKEVENEAISKALERINDRSPPSPLERVAVTFHAGESLL